VTAGPGSPTPRIPEVPPAEAAAIRARLAELAGRPQPPATTLLTEEALSRLAALRVDTGGRHGVLVPVLAATQLTWTAMMALVDALVTPDGHRITVHAYEDVRLMQELRAGELYTSSAMLTGVQPSRSGTRIAFTITGQDSAGQPAVSIVNTAYVRGLWADKGWGEVATDPGGALTGEGPQRRTSLTLSPTVTDSYAEVSGDRNPIHLSDPHARAVGLPGRIVHGLCTYGTVAQAVLDLHGLQTEAVGRVWASFRDVVLPGDRIDVEVSGSAPRLTAVARTGRGTVAVECAVELTDSGAAPSS
jgi:acyl dehydratase